MTCSTTQKSFAFSMHVTNARLQKYSCCRPAAGTQCCKVYDWCSCCATTACYSSWLCCCGRVVPHAAFGGTRT
jgi:hypothetical protein